MIVQHKGINITISLWKDNCPVVVIASNTDFTKKETVQRRKKDGSRETYSCPAIDLYNRYMGSVNHNDQLRGYYHTPIKCHKSYKYFCFLCDIAITNSFILSKEFSALDTKTMKNFRVELAKQLIGNCNSRKRAGRVSITSGKRFCQHHFSTCRMWDMSVLFT